MTIKNSAMLCLTLSLCVLSGCTQQTATEPAPDAAVQAEPDAQPMQAAHAGGQTATGTVLETMDAASYTYVKVDTGSEEIWAAASHFEVAVGDRVVVPLEMPMQGFHSDALDRDFELIYFASSILPEGAASGPSLPPGHPPLGSTEQAVQAGSLEPAAGGVTVADVWARSADLAGQKITVRGEVVRFNGGILGRNWLHLQDGSGSVDQGTHDLTVTSSEAAAVGDTVTATGIVAVNKDFGAGYVYAVMIEEASIAAE